MSDLYKDKIEVSLDGRQVFYLFFGGALLACMVFVLGVLVGKRVEARAHLDRAATTAARDPLAALDRLATEGPRELSFRQALTGGAATATEVDRTIAELEQARAPAAPAKISAPAARPEARPEAARPEARPEAVKPAPQPAEIAKPRKGKWTLQLSAFQDEAEAESFLTEIKALGYDAFVAEANIPDKGTFFRVRVGNYLTYQAAVDAKTAFERKVKKIAYVTRT